MKMSVARGVGNDFFDYLRQTERTDVTNRLELKEIYNQEFRRRDEEVKRPNFYSVVLALKVSFIVTVRKKNLTYNYSGAMEHQDQWRTYRSRRRQHVPNPDPAQPAPAEPEPRSHRNLAKKLLKKLKTDRPVFIADKNGVCIRSDHTFNDGTVELTTDQDVKHVVKMFVENTGTVPVHFTYYTPLHFLQDFKLVDEHKVTRNNPLTLEPGKSYEIQVHVQFALYGFYLTTLAFEFKLDLQSAAFYIVRFIEVRCLSTLGVELGPTAPFRRAVPMFYLGKADNRIVDGQRPEGLSTSKLQYTVPLGKYPLPKCMPQMVQALKKEPPTDQRKTLESELCFDNYAKKFRLLLQLEENQMETDLRMYNIPNSERDPATMTRDPHSRNLLILQVPGVSENRPSVLRGDKIMVTRTDNPKVTYCGYVHSVQLDCIRLGFSCELLDVFIEGMKFNVEFSVSRFLLQLQYRALEMVPKNNLGPLLFPAAPADDPSDPSDLPRLKFFDSKLEKNDEQRTAVGHIVAGSSRPAPYLVFGPPGTGKTVTMVEAIKQIEKTQAGSRILACAPSNSAADLLCKKIIEHVDRCTVYRMFAASRDPLTVPEDLKTCSNLEGDSFVFPAKEDLKKFRILVTTLFTAGRLVSGNMTDHFTHIFVDEAGHAVETECIIPFAGLLQVKSGQVVLAGDPKQLGPIVRSPFAIRHGFKESLLERIMTDFPQYQKNDDGLYDNRFVTKLLKNYRSHPAILKIPNELFYDGDLQYCADEIVRNSYCQWTHLPKKGFPVIFRGVTGMDDREGNSPSFFNAYEVVEVVKYVKILLETQAKKGLASIHPRDIGIIAPYRKQVQKIRQALRKVQKDLRKDLSDLKVGSVEEFQGQERRVILVSTVRGSRDYAEVDQKFHLGFVKNEKRFNVAMTRAKALLVVVGNPQVLQVDPVWNRFLQYCRAEAGYSGYAVLEEEDDIVARLQALSLGMLNQEENEVSDVQQQLDPEWRNDL